MFGDFGGLKLPDICLTGEEKPRKNLTQETCSDRGTNPGTLRDRRACCCLAHSDGPAHGAQFISTVLVLVKLGFLVPLKYSYIMFSGCATAILQQRDKEDRLVHYRQEESWLKHMADTYLLPAPCLRMGQHVPWPGTATFGGGKFFEPRSLLCHFMIRVFTLMIQILEFYKG